MRTETKFYNSFYTKGVRRSRSVIFGLQNRLGRKILITNKAGRHAGLSCGKNITGKSSQMLKSKNVEKNWF